MQLQISQGGFDGHGGGDRQAGGGVGSRANPKGRTRRRAGVGGRCGSVRLLKSPGLSAAAERVKELPTAGCVHKRHAALIHR